MAGTGEIIIGFTWGVTLRIHTFANYCFLLLPSARFELIYDNSQQLQRNSEVKRRLYGVFLITFFASILYAVAASVVPQAGVRVIAHEKPCNLRAVRQ
jgi:hypothetical protein